MSGSISASGLTTPTLTSAASQAAANAGSSTGGTGGALSQLSGNYNDFLKLLMTQLQNQDPTSPMDTNQFTTELVQFSSVEQQIATNTSLTSLIQLTQSGQLLQSSALVGHQVAFTSTNVALQSGSAHIEFNAATAEPVTVTVADAQGKTLRQDVVNATAGTNTWSWDGTTASGATMPDGAYAVTATTPSGTTTVSAVPFTVIGTAAGLAKSGSSLNLQVGGVSTDLSTVTSVLN
jgi:flagellar basal-body rod modification protein FlgD